MLELVSLEFWVIWVIADDFEFSFVDCWRPWVATIPLIRFEMSHTLEDKAYLAEVETKLFKNGFEIALLILVAAEILMKVIECWSEEDLVDLEFVENATKQFIEVLHRLAPCHSCIVQQLLKQKRRWQVVFASLND